MEAEMEETKRIKVLNYGDESIDDFWYNVLEVTLGYRIMVR